MLTIGLVVIKKVLKNVKLLTDDNGRIPITIGGLSYLVNGEKLILASKL